MYSNVALSRRLTERCLSGLKALGAVLILVSLPERCLSPFFCAILEETFVPIKGLAT